MRRRGRERRGEKERGEVEGRRREEEERGEIERGVGRRRKEIGESWRRRSEVRVGGGGERRGER